MVTLTSHRPAGRARSGHQTRRDWERTAWPGCSTSARPNTAATPHCAVTSWCWPGSRSFTSRPARRRFRGLSEARAELRDVAPLEVIEGAVETWQNEEARLAGVRRAVGLVEEALRGRRYVARL